MAEQQGDDRVLHRIERLVAEEQDIYHRQDLDEHGRHRLAALQTELDQCWDLLRQRRALREFGENPDRATARPPRIVENYEQ